MEEHQAQLADREVCLSQNSYPTVDFPLCWKCLYGLPVCRNVCSPLEMIIPLPSYVLFQFLASLPACSHVLYLIILFVSWGKVPWSPFPFFGKLNCTGSPVFTPETEQTHFHAYISYWLNVSSFYCSEKTTTWTEENWRGRGGNQTVRSS